MDELRQKVDALVSYIFEKCPNGLAKDQAVFRLQESVWWCEKTFEDERIKQNAPKTDKAE